MWPFDKIFDMYKIRGRVVTKNTRCAYCGEVGDCFWYGPQDYSYWTYWDGSACCLKCDEANNIKWEQKLLDEKPFKASKKQLATRKERDRILKDSKDING